VDAYYYFEPGYTLKFGLGAFGKLQYNLGTFARTVRNKIFGGKRGYILERRVSGKRIMKAIAQRDYAENEFPGVIPDWDNTPRRGYKGLVYTNTSPELFEKTLKILRDKTEDHTVDFVFVNAWNEWGEGAFVEPDESRGYAYLEAIKRAVL
jgi:hypothetical protein